VSILMRINCPPYPLTRSRSHVIHRHAHTSRETAFIPAGLGGRYRISALDPQVNRARGAMRDHPHHILDSRKTTHVKHPTHAQPVEGLSIQGRAARLSPEDGPTADLA